MSAGGVEQRNNKHLYLPVDIDISAGGVEQRNNKHLYLPVDIDISAGGVEQRNNKHLYLHVDIDMHLFDDMAPAWFRSCDDNSFIERLHLKLCCILLSC